VIEGPQSVSIALVPVMSLAPIDVDAADRGACDVNGRAQDGAYPIRHERLRQIQPMIVMRQVRDLDGRVVNKGLDAWAPAGRLLRGLQQSGAAIRRCDIPQYVLLVEQHDSGAVNREKAGHCSRDLGQSGSNGEAFEIS